MKQREDTIRKWFSLWLDSREAELSDLFTEDAAYIESWGPEYYGREMIARWFRDWHRSGQVLRWDIQEFLDSENTTVVRWYFQCQISGEAPTGFDGLSLIRWSVDEKSPSFKNTPAPKSGIIPMDKQRVLYSLCFHIDTPYGKGMASIFCSYIKPAQL